MASISTPASSYQRAIATASNAFCRYVLRPPVAQNRLRLAADGQVRFALRHAWSDGTTLLLFEPVELQS